MVPIIHVKVLPKMFHLKWSHHGISFIDSTSTSPPFRLKTLTSLGANGLTRVKGLKIKLVIHVLS